MSRAWDQLIEARIREWQERKRRGEELPRDPSGPVDSIETQLFDEVVRLRRSAREAADPQRRDRLLDQAEQLRIRLAILLEQNGYHRLADNLDERIAAAVRGPAGAGDR